MARKHQMRRAHLYGCPTRNDAVQRPAGFVALRLYDGLLGRHNDAVGVDVGGMEIGGRFPVVSWVHLRCMSWDDPFSTTSMSGFHTDAAGTMTLPKTRDHVA